MTNVIQSKSLLFKSHKIEFDRNYSDNIKKNINLKYRLSHNQQSEIKYLEIVSYKVSLHNMRKHCYHNLNMIRVTITLHNFYVEFVRILGLKYVLYIDVHVSLIRVKDILYEHFELCFIAELLFIVTFKFYCSYIGSKTTAMQDMTNL